MALVQSLFLWLLFSSVDYLDWRSNGQWTSLVWLAILFGFVLNPIWLYGYTVATLRTAIASRRSLPPLSVSHLVPKGIRPTLSSVILFAYFVYFAALIMGLPYVVRLYQVEFNLVALVKTFALLASQGAIVALCALLTLIYFVGVARYAAVGGGQAIAAFKANQLLPSRYTAETAKYLLLQILLLGAAALLINLGTEAVHEIRPRGLGYASEDWRAMAWSALGTFLFLCGYLTFWNASLHLLAQYAAAIGIRPDDHGPTKAKGKRELNILRNRLGRDRPSVAMPVHDLLEVVQFALEDALQRQVEEDPKPEKPAGANVEGLAHIGLLTAVLEGDRADEGKAPVRAFEFDFLVALEVGDIAVDEAAAAHDAARHRHHRAGADRVAAGDADALDVAPMHIVVEIPDITEYVENRAINQHLRFKFRHISPTFAAKRAMSRVAAHRKEPLAPIQRNPHHYSLFFVALQRYLLGLQGNRTKLTCTTKGHKIRVNFVICRLFASTMPPPKEIVL